MTRLSDLNPNFLRANREKLAEEGLNPVTLPMDLDKPTKADVRLEKYLQRDVENWLRQNGWWKRTPEWILIELPPRGWLIHLHKAKKNPILLDIVLLGNDGRYTEFELKLPTGHWSSESQRILCQEHGKKKFDTFDAAIEHVKEWQDK